MKVKGFKVKVKDDPLTLFCATDGRTLGGSSFFSHDRKSLGLNPRDFYLTNSSWRYVYLLIRNQLENNVGAPPGRQIMSCTL